MVRWFVFLVHSTVPTPFQGITFPISNPPWDWKKIAWPWFTKNCNLILWNNRLFIYAPCTDPTIRHTIRALEKNNATQKKRKYRQHGKEYEAFYKTCKYTLTLRVNGIKIWIIATFQKKNQDILGSKCKWALAECLCFWSGLCKHRLITRYFCVYIGGVSKVMLTDPGTMWHSRKSKNNLNSHLPWPLTSGMFVQVVGCLCILWSRLLSKLYRCSPICLEHHTYVCLNRIVLLWIVLLLRKLQAVSNLHSNLSPYFQSLSLLVNHVFHSLNITREFTRIS